MNKDQYIEQFISTFECKNPKELIKIWHDRTKDNFYKILEEIKSLSNKYFENETNPIVFVMMAYCFDGDKPKTIEKTINALSQINDDIITNKIKELNKDSIINYETIIDTNSTISINQYFDFVLTGFDDEYGMYVKDIKIVKAPGSSKYLIELKADEDDLKWLSNNLFSSNDANPSKHDLIFSLYSKYDDIVYDLFYMTDSYTTDFIDNTSINESVIIDCNVEKIYIAAESDKQFIEDIKSNIENKLKSYLI